MRYLYWLRLYAFPLGLNQGRWNMLHSEYIQLKDRRMTTDPKDAGIARLTTELRVYMDAAEAHAVETMRQRDRAEKAEAERDAANALLRRITRNVDADGVGTVLIIDLQAASAHLGAKP